MSFVQNLKARFESWSAVRQAEAELNAFSDRELADLGINRSDIPYLVRQKSPAEAGAAVEGELSARASRRFAG